MWKFKKMQDERAARKYACVAYFVSIRLSNACSEKFQHAVNLGYFEKNVEEG